MPKYFLKGWEGETPIFTSGSEVSHNLSQLQIREKIIRALFCKRGHLTLCDFSYKSKKIKNLG